MYIRGVGICMQGFCLASPIRHVDRDKSCTPLAALATSRLVVGVEVNMNTSSRLWVPMGEVFPPLCRGYNRVMCIQDSHCASYRVGEAPFSASRRGLGRKGLYLSFSL